MSAVCHVIPALSSFSWLRHSHFLWACCTSDGWAVCCLWMCLSSCLASAISSSLWGSLTWPDLRPSFASSSCLRVPSSFSCNTLSITSDEVRGPAPGTRRKCNWLPISSWSFLLRDWVVPLLYMNAMSRWWSQQASLMRLPLSFSCTSVEGYPVSLWGRYSLRSLNHPSILDGSMGPQPLINLVRWNSVTHTNNRLVSCTIP